MAKTIPKKKAGRPKKVVLPKEPIEEPKAVPTPILPPKEVKPTLPIIEGVQAVEIIKETEMAIEYRLANGTTTFVAKK